MKVYPLYGLLLSCEQAEDQFRLQDFLSLPANVDGKSAEANYAKEYTRRVAAAKLDVASLNQPTLPVPQETFLFSVSGGKVADMASQQTELFSKLGIASVMMRRPCTLPTLMYGRIIRRATLGPLSSMILLPI